MSDYCYDNQLDNLESLLNEILDEMKIVTNHYRDIQNEKKARELSTEKLLQSNDYDSTRYGNQFPPY